MKTGFISFYIILCITTYMYRNGDIFIKEIPKQPSLKNTNRLTILDDCDIAVKSSIYKENQNYKECQINKRKNDLFQSLFNQNTCSYNLNKSNSIKASCIEFSKKTIFKIGSAYPIPKDLKFNANCKGIIQDIRWSTGSIIDQPYLSLKILCGTISDETDVPIIVSKI